MKLAEGVVVGHPRARFYDAILEEAGPTAASA